MGKRRTKRTQPAHWEARAFKPPEILTIADAAKELRFSKAHLAKVLNGQVPGVPYLPHLRIGAACLSGGLRSINGWQRSSVLKVVCFLDFQKSRPSERRRTINAKTASKR